MMAKKVANKIGHIAIDVHEHINGNFGSLHKLSTTIGI